MFKQVNWKILGQCGNIARALGCRDKFGMRYFFHGARAMVRLDMFGLKYFFYGLGTLF